MKHNIFKFLAGFMLVNALVSIVSFSYVSGMAVPTQKQQGEVEQ